jgi:hypothetical protein
VKGHEGMRFAWAATVPHSLATFELTRHAQACTDCFMITFLRSPELCGAWNRDLTRSMDSHAGLTSQSFPVELLTRAAIPQGL